MDRIRGIFKKIDAEEQRLLVSREKAARHTASSIIAIVAVGMLISIVLLLLVYYVLHRQIRIRARNELELEESREWFSMTLDSLGDAVVATDNQFKIMYLNPVAEELTGWSVEEARGKAVDLIYHAVHAVNRSKVEVPVISAISQKHIVSPDVLPILIRKDGRELYVDSRGAPIISSQGHVIGSVLIFRDVTEQKQLSDKLTSHNVELEEQIIAKTNELIRYEHRLKLTLDNMLEGAQLLDFNWRYVYVNNMLVEQSGVPKEKLSGSTMQEHFPGLEDTELFRQLKLCMEERVTRQFEYEFTCPGKPRGWFKLVVQPVPEGLFILSVDINQRKKAEQEGREYTRTLEDMLFMTSHKVRQPVSQIMGIAHMLEHPLESQEDLMKVVGYMKGAVSSLDVVTREFVDFLYDQRQKRDAEF
jgi:PAS domain S-box-containing protein